MPDTPIVRPTLTLLALLTLLTGLIYPFALTGIAQLVWPAQANGSLIYAAGVATGSRLIGQPFDDPAYFWPRPSATLPTPYTATASGGSNRGPTSAELRAEVQARIAALRAADPTNQVAVPVELVTASASGLDPHLSPAGAAYQTPRVARARGLDPAAVQVLVDKLTTGRTWGLLGEPRVNVLELNLALDALTGPPPGRMVVTSRPIP